MGKGCMMLWPPWWTNSERTRPNNNQKKCCQEEVPQEDKRTGPKSSKESPEECRHHRPDPEPELAAVEVINSE